MKLNLRPIPARVAPTVLASIIHAEQSESIDLQDQLSDRIKEIFFPSAAAIHWMGVSREGLYETCLNTFPAGTILICVNGPLSRQWLNIAKTLEIDFELLDCNYGAAFLPSDFEKALAKEKYEAVFLVDIDPYTGLKTNIQTITEQIRREQPSALIIVDCSASLSASAPMDLNHEADIVIASSEIALGLPAGLGLIAINDRAQFKALAQENKGWTLNFVRQQQMRRENAFLSEPPIEQLCALKKQLDLIFLESLPIRVERIRKMGEKVRGWALQRGLSILSDEDSAAPTVTAIHTLAQFSPQQLIDSMKTYGVLIGACPEELADEYFVIAHMGETTMTDMDTVLALLDRFLADYDTQTSLPKTSRRFSLHRE